MPVVNAARNDIRRLGAVVRAVHVQGQPIAGSIGSGRVWSMPTVMVFCGTPGSFEPAVIGPPNSGAVSPVPPSEGTSA